VLRGTIPGLICGGCHGDDEAAVFAELCEIAEEIVVLHRTGGKPLPPPTIGRALADVLALERASDDAAEGEIESLVA
jgi:hypothetical protein